MNNLNLNSRQEELLKMIVKEFIEYGIPIGSKKLVEKYNLKKSSATIRSEMVALEKYGLLEKAHKSSGRIPTTQGYNFYIKNIEKQALDINLKVKLNRIFAKRLYSIDETIEEAVKLISETTDLTLITTNHESSELMKSIQLVPLNDDNATIVFVTSTGRVFSKLLKISAKLKIDDVQTAVRLFRDRLKDTPLIKLKDKIDVLVPILKNSIANVEYLLQQFVKQVFNFNDSFHSKVYGRTNIVKQEAFQTKEKLLYIMRLLDDHSIWDSIKNTAKYEEDHLKINLSDNNIAIISQKMDVNNIKREISVIGSRRMEYQKVLSILNYLSKMIQGKDSNNGV